MDNFIEKVQKFYFGDFLAFVKSIKALLEDLKVLEFCHKSD